MNTLSLVLPGLLVPAQWLADAGWRARLDAFESLRRLSRSTPVQAAAAAPASRERAAHGDPGGRGLDERLRSLPHERWLAARFGLDGPATWCGATGPADGAADATWRIDPVTLQAGLDHVSLVDRGEGQDRRDAGEPDRPAVLQCLADLVAAIAPVLSDNALRIRQASAGRWYLDDGAGLRLAPATPGAAFGRSIDGLLPRGEDARRWRRILTEIEMTWHGHPANDALRAAGAAPVTSLWLAGPVPKAARPAASALAGPDASLRGVALLAGVRHVGTDDAAALPLLFDAANAAAGTEHGASTGARNCLLLHERLLPARLSGDPVGWLDAWRATDALIVGALSLLDARTVDAVDIVATGLHRIEHRRMARAGFFEGLFARRATGAPAWLHDDEDAAEDRT